MGVQETGSLLLATNAEERWQLEERAEQLRGEGLTPEVLDSKALREAEPSLRVSDSMSGLLLKTDAQIVSPHHAAQLMHVDYRAPHNPILS